LPPGVVSGDDRAVKPTRRRSLLAASLLKLPPQNCIYIGDDLRDAQACPRAGMHFVAAGWGYHGEGGDPKRLDADAVVRPPREVIDLFS